MRYLITGGAGFVGSNIASELVRRGDSVRILDNFSTGKAENLASIQSDVEVIEGDICNEATIATAIKGVDAVLHQAAIASVQYSVKYPVESTDVNMNGTLKLLEASRQAGVKRFVFASSSAVYGDLPELPKREETKTDPLSPYAGAKLNSETYCKVYNDLYGLETVCLRYFNIFGPHQDPSSEYSAVIPKFITMLIKGQSPVVFGDGEQSRDFVYVANVVQANLLAATSRDAAGGIFNIASGERFTLNELLHSLKQITGSEVDVSYDKPRAGDIVHSYADISLAEQRLGYKTEIDFETGLRRTAEWFSQD